MKNKQLAPVLVILGVTGDLSQRKLLPALYQLLTHDILDPSTTIIGTSRRAVNEAELLNEVKLCVLEAEKVCDPVGLERMRSALQLVQLDPAKGEDYKQLKTTLDDLDNHGLRERLIYLAIPPHAYGPIITQLGEQGLNDSRTRLLVEKPFGRDLLSATELIKLTDKYFQEPQVYRIDHYLAKESAQNLLTFRLHNPIFAPLWNSEHIEKVHISATETLGVENRQEFYEQTGALRDIIQNHLMQLLALVMMDQPVDQSSESIHEGKEAFLKSLALADPAKAVRGQYDGYKEEVGNPSSIVETYARVELQSRLSRWQDTTIVLETGKAMAEKLTEVIVQFKHPHERRRNQLRFRLQPNEGISLDLVVKVPGFEEQMQHTELDFSYNEVFQTGGEHPDAYERVIMDAVHGDRSLFASSDELLTAWHVLQPIIDKWTTDGRGLKLYTPGATEV